MDDQFSGHHPYYGKGHENLYVELNRWKDLKWTYRKKYKDLQAVVTTAEHNVTLQQLAKRQRTYWERERCKVPK